MAEAADIDALTASLLEEIITAARPDAALAALGGQTKLHFALEVGRNETPARRRNPGSGAHL